MSATGSLLTHSNEPQQLQTRPNRQFQGFGLRAPGRGVHETFTRSDMALSIVSSGRPSGPGERGLKAGCATYPLAGASGQDGAG